MPNYLPKPGQADRGNAPGALAVLALAAAMVACSQGGSPAPGAPARESAPEATLDTGFDPVPEARAPQAPDNGAGIWYGTLSRGDVTDSPVSCLITEAGEISCLLYETGVPPVLLDDPILGRYAKPQPASGSALGTIELADTAALSGSGSLYAAPGQVLSDGISTVAPFTITAGSLRNPTIDDPQFVMKNLDLTISSLGVESTLRATFDNSYFGILPAGGGIGIDRLQGEYLTFAIFDEAASLSIDADGSLFSQSASGCVLSGHVDLIDSRYNAYSAEATMASCSGLDGAYAGFAFMNEYSLDNGIDQLLIMLFNTAGFISGEARKY
jgi:hypothetical protein